MANQADTFNAALELPATLLQALRAALLSQPTAVRSRQSVVMPARLFFDRFDEPFIEITFPDHSTVIFSLTGSEE